MSTPLEGLPVKSVLVGTEKIALLDTDNVTPKATTPQAIQNSWPVTIVDIIGALHQILVDPSTPGELHLSLPQDIDLDSNVIFGSLLAALFNRHRTCTVESFTASVASVSSAPPARYGFPLFTVGLTMAAVVSSGAIATINVAEGFPTGTLNLVSFGFVQNTATGIIYGGCAFNYIDATHFTVNVSSGVAAAIANQTCTFRGALLPTKVA